MKHSPFDAIISALDAENLALGTATLVLGAAISMLVQIFPQYQSGVSYNCGVGITRQMCNRVTNNGDMGTFSRPG